MLGFIGIAFPEKISDHRQLSFASKENKELKSLCQLFSLFKREFFDFIIYTKINKMHPL
ncbi:Hypothetical protein Minf_1009 [Methylacidiphilum infernorum V4]|uniref:Uncharacterized protein n=1 Tax=Methylacidiphilum infernorum (isolate V4) TaxID=481448 RepID=B3DUR1_METI4|nr:Hypothetical protein Minf_1009 [Methylacidiphilum infernorum V4]